VSWRRWFAGRERFDGRSGRPRSANGASSFHLIWDAPPGAWVAAETTLEITEPPRVAALYFWALQVSFVDRGRAAGGAHFGLQWYPPHPGSTAVNWGGYGPTGRELDGSGSSLPSAVGNPNTRDYAWRPRTSYRLLISGPDAPDYRGTGGWLGEIVDEQQGTRIAVREVWVTASTLEAPMVWSEVFADCDAPSTTVRWRECTLISDTNERTSITAARVNYQAVHDGGCVTTNSSTDGDWFVQTTGTTRVTPAGARLEVERDGPS
jgi:hypothetical protein